MTDLVYSRPQTATAIALPPQLSTSRLLLRPLRVSDADDFYAYAKDPEVARTTSWDAHRSIDESRAFLERAVRGYERGERTLWAIELLDSTRMIGTIGLHEVNALHARATLAYALARPFWKQGLTTEAARRIVSYGFAAMNLNRVEAFCLPENVASRRVMEHLGMSYEGTMRERMFLKGAWRDLTYFAVLRSGWTTREGLQTAPMNA